MKFKLRHFHQSGDTIVEVLIAIAIVSSVLVGGFVVTQASSRAVRTGQEHSEMLQILQGQVERIRALAQAQGTDTGGIFAPGNFCIDASNPAVPVRVAATSSKCNAINSLYNVSASYDSSTSVFTVVGTWDNLGGGTNKEQLTYRVYSGKPVTAAPSVNPGSGTADIGSTGCNTDPITGACIVYPIPTYRWKGYFVNKSNNASVALSCLWEWDDGTTSNTACNFNDTITHQYTPQAVQAYPASCYAYIKNVKLTLKLANGQNPTVTYPRSMPQCY
jgi:Tfp pilus assembly protein PilV